MDALTKTPREAAGAPNVPPGALRARDVWWLALGCGLIVGPLEVGAVVLHKEFGPNHFYWMSRHFLWLVPLTDLLLFAGTGAVLGLLAAAMPRFGGRIAPRFLGAMALASVLWAAVPRIQAVAALVLATGAAIQLVPLLERRGAALRLGLRLGARAAIAITAGLAAWALLEDRVREGREDARRLPTESTASVLLIVLDTVAASHLGLHGYDRPTSPTLDALARRGIRFEQARAVSSWTLPSHASIFTGRWPHELSTGWFTPLDETFSTLAEHLGERGLATAGFVGNLYYCGADSGLRRGFARYQDYIFPGLSAFRWAALIDRPLEGLRAVDRFARRRAGLSWLSPVLARFDAGNRKPASAVSREFLDWLAARRRPERPFFAFLNYFDAHFPYQVPEGGIRRFGARPRTERERDLIENWRTIDKPDLSAREVAFARDAYDDCIADLDEQIGRLVDELERRGVLERTWLVITSDHGESFGERPGDFGHGTSVYGPQVHVPLLFVPPGRAKDTARKGLEVPGAVSRPVSLRDLPATIVDLLGQGEGSPLPGVSLARLWRRDATTSAAGPKTSAVALSPAISEVVPTDHPAQGDFGRLRDRPVWAALAEKDAVYVRAREKSVVREELYVPHDDDPAARDLAAGPAREALLGRLRATLDRWTAGPLTADRFQP